MGIISINGVSSESLGVTVDGYPVRHAAERRVSSVAIPGRNGNLLIDDGTYNNYPQEYTLYWVVGVTEDQTVYDWLRQGEYLKFVDSDFPDYFRMAQITGPLVPKNYRDCYKELQIKLNFMPQWWLNSGDIWQSKVITSPDTELTIENPTLEYALPLLFVSKQSEKDTMTVSVNGEQFQMVPYGSTTVYYIDCELQEVYYQESNRNPAFVGKFPSLQPGLNTIQFTGTSGDTAYISIKPRWWTA